MSDNEKFTPIMECQMQQQVGRARDKRFLIFRCEDYDHCLHGMQNMVHSVSTIEEARDFVSEAIAAHQKRKKLFPRSMRFFDHEPVYWAKSFEIAVGDECFSVYDRTEGIMLDIGGWII